jgi:hypothetical protein
MKKYLVFFKLIDALDWEVVPAPNFEAAIAFADQYQRAPNTIALVCNVNVMAQIAKAIAEERKDN